MLKVRMPNMMVPRSVSETRKCLMPENPGRARGGILAVLVFAASLAACFRPPGRDDAGAAPPRPRDANILLVTLDTVRADHLSCYNPQSVPTPNIDAVAARGARFLQAVAQVPLTTPSHASILTGTYPQVHKVRDMGGFILDKSIPTLASLAHEAGFETAAFVGSAVLNHNYGLNRGFETYNDDMGTRRDDGLLPGVLAEIRGDAVTGRALEWLQQHHDSSGRSISRKNFFLWVHYYDPHFPYSPPIPFKSKYQKDPYSGEIAYTDAQVGRLLVWLKDHALDGKTLVVLMADHGESLGEHGESTHGIFLYDSTIHIPLIIAGPGIPKGQVLEPQVRSIDIMPTVADFLSISPGIRVQGTSLMPLLISNQRVSTGYSYMETLYPKTGMGWSELRGMRTERWKLILAPKPELYKMGEDRAEKLNVKDRFPADADHLQKKVWEIDGPPGSIRKLERSPVDDETLRQLQSLGYVSGGRRELIVDTSGPDPKDRIEILGVLERSADLMNRGRYSDAVPMLKSIQPKDAPNPAIYQQLGVCLERTGQFQKAVDIYREAITNHAESDHTYASIGNNFVRMGRLQEAADAMEKAATMNRTNLQNLANLATAYMQLGRPEQCEKTLNEILGQDARYGQAYNIYGVLLLHRGDERGARSYMEKAVEFDPDLCETYLSLGSLAQRAGQPQIAAGYYRKFLEKLRPGEHENLIPRIKAAIAHLDAKP
jgi:choline-sulfatase